MNTRIIFAALLMLSFVTTDAKPPEEQGRLIFSSRCAACHNVNKTLTGPALAGVHQRRSIDWIVNFVQSSQTMIKGGDKDAQTLFEQFNKIPMPDHRDLSRSDIESIVDYIKANTATAGASVAPFKKPAKLRPAYVPVSFSKDLGFFVSFFAALFILILSLLFLVYVKEMQRNKLLNISDNA